ncbi:sensor histidine kinase [Kushneria phosphatilytica]|uniref:sensor histidine kinase n=1 Tax=Kushneria phosphatilytica TaxID=657387 RepID=UPI0008D92696|nr:ATP-binding protein [Kushneria phosphatilytica]OHV13928.1 two-component sensor histidine kinase [Kushneria phosphatilytica]
MTSIRQRTVALVLGALAIGTLVIGVFNFRDSSHEIAEIYDAQLAQTARILQGILHTPLAAGTRRELYQSVNDALANAGHTRYGHPYESKMAFRVWRREGTDIVSSASAPPLSTMPQHPFTEIRAGGVGWHGFLLPDDKEDMMIWVGERDDVRADLVDRIVRHTLTPNVIGLFLLALLVWLAVGWGLRPLRRMAQLIRQRDAESLAPLKLAPLPTELEPMQAALNRLLQEIDTLLKRERRFIADAAHELRTPLAVLRLNAQNALEARSEQARIESLGYIISGTDGLARVFNQLLVLARMEPKPEWQDEDRMEVYHVLQQTLVELSGWVLDKGLDFVLDAEPGHAQVRGDPTMLGIAIQNLVTNAVNVSPAGGEIRVVLEVEEAHCEIRVLDQGPGLDQEQAARMFERFYSRGSAEGAGLGLSIVQTITHHLGGTVTLENRSEGGACATLRLPLVH